MHKDTLKNLVKMIEQEGYTVSKAAKEVSKVYLPENGDEYYFVDERGTYNYCETWDGDDTDKHLFSSGNCFRTAQEAENYKALTYATTRVINRLRELEGGCVTHSCCVNGFGRLVIYPLDSSVHQSRDWHSTYEAWEIVIKEISNDVKLMLGVKQ